MLGERLLAPVREVMRRDDLPTCAPETRVSDLPAIISAGGIGMVLVMEGDALRGVITDGDIRRALGSGRDLEDLRAGTIMTKSPKTIGPDAPMFEAEMMMREARITVLVVADRSGRVLGAVQIHD